MRDLIMPAEDTLAPPRDGTWLPIGRLDVTIDKDDRALGLALYEDHLRSIVLAAREHGIPILLTTVATNIRDHLDNGTPGQPSKQETAALNALQGMADKVPKGRFAAEANRLAPDIKTEGGLHRLGQLYLSAQLPEIAADTLARKELSALRPMTSNRAMRSTVKQLGQTYGIKVCDLAGALASSAPDGIPGNDVFIDHCHPNAAGHQVLGKALASCILEMGIGGLKHATQKITPDPLSPLRVDHYSGHRRIPGYQTNPTPPDKTTLQGMAMAGHQAFVQDRFDDALSAYQAALSMGDPSGHIHYSIGLTQLYRGNLSASRTAFQRALEAGVSSAHTARQALGD